MSTTVSMYTTDSNSPLLDACASSVYRTSWAMLRRLVSCRRWKASSHPSGSYFETDRFQDWSMLGLGFPSSRSHRPRLRW